MHEYNKHGMTAVMMACKGEGNINLVRLLHSSGILACSMYLAGLQLKIAETGARLDDTSMSGTTPLMFAVAEDKVEIVKYLLANGKS